MSISGDQKGRRIGPYTLLDRLGRGAMGVVWRARDDDLDRDVAIKMMTPPGDDERLAEELAQRFLLEAKAAARIKSRHVVQVLQLGRTDEGDVFIVMELLEGTPLNKLMQGEGPLAPPRALRIARQIARGMAAAHALGVVHRDLKPGNVMLAQVDGEETVKILDFGIAKLTQAGDSRGLTQNGAMLGTIPYMAPEQVLGKAVDARTDVYALGVVLFRMLTGQPLFDAENLSDVVRHQVGTVAPRLSERVPELKAVPELEAIVARCLEKDPAKRFQSMSDLDAALAALDGQMPERSASTPRARVEETLPTNAKLGDISFGAGSAAPTLTFQPARADDDTRVSQGVGETKLDRPAAPASAVAAAPSASRLWMVFAAAGVVAFVGIAGTAVWAVTRGTATTTAVPALVPVPVPVPDSVVPVPEPTAKPAEPPPEEAGRGEGSASTTTPVDAAPPAPAVGPTPTPTTPKPVVAKKPTAATKDTAKPKEPMKAKDAAPPKDAKKDSFIRVHTKEGQ